MQIWNMLKVSCIRFSVDVYITVQYLLAKYIHIHIILIIYKPERVEIQMRLHVTHAFQHITMIFNCKMHILQPSYCIKRWRILLTIRTSAKKHLKCHLLKLSVTYTCLHYLLICVWGQAVVPDPIGAVSSAYHCLTKTLSKHFSR